MCINFTSTCVLIVSLLSTFKLYFYSLCCEIWFFLKVCVVFIGYIFTVCVVFIDYIFIVCVPRIRYIFTIKVFTFLKLYNLSFYVF